MAPARHRPGDGQPVGPEPPPPIMDITVKMNEGKQFFVNRITFAGNTTTHDAVIRRELRLVEGGVFNAEALKESVRRLNQLGYFKPIEGKEGEIDVTPTPGDDEQVDIKLKFEEQNRNQLSFGAGVSQFDGFFGQLSFQTSNFLGRGETVGVSLQKGSQARQYQMSFTEPYLFERPITAGVGHLQPAVHLPAAVHAGRRPAATGCSDSRWPTTRGCSWRTATSGCRSATSTRRISTPEVLKSSPYLADSLLHQSGRAPRSVSKISPSVVFNTVNQPIFPDCGPRLHAAVWTSPGLGGNTDYVQAAARRHLVQAADDARPRSGCVPRSRIFGRTAAPTTLPIFEKLFLGGEYSIRGFDLRAISAPRSVAGVAHRRQQVDRFNAEYYITADGSVAAGGFLRRRTGPRHRLNRSPEPSR